MHSKQVGSLGELKVAAALTSKGYFVFKELGDNCKSDLIVMAEDYVPIKVQVKACTVVNGAVSVSSHKSGPNYRFRYECKHADIFAVFVVDTQEIFYVLTKDLLQKQTLTFRVSKARNNQSMGVRQAKDYCDFERVLRGHTPDTLADSAEGDDMVQTTTSNRPEKSGVVG